MGLSPLVVDALAGRHLITGLLSWVSRLQKWSASLAAASGVSRPHASNSKLDVGFERLCQTCPAAAQLEQSPQELLWERALGACTGPGLWTVGGQVKKSTQQPGGGGVLALHPFCLGAVVQVMPAGYTWAFGSRL